MSEAKSDKDILRHIQAFDEDTFVEASAADEIFDISSKVDIQRPLKTTPQKNMPINIQPANTTEIEFTLPPPDDIRLAGFVTAVFIFALIAILCYYFAR